MNGFVITYDGKQLVDGDKFVLLGSTVEERDGVTVRSDRYASVDGEIGVETFTTRYADSPIIQRRITIENKLDRVIRVTRLDPFHGLLPRGQYTLDYFVSINHEEFTPRTVPLEGTIVLQTTAGRSSQGTHPWFTLRDADGGVLAATVAWSGNWIFRFEPQLDGMYWVSGGMNDWEFFKKLAPGEKLESVSVMYTQLPVGSLDAVSVAFGRWGKRFWYPENEISRNVPVSWNHWWPYEDNFINEDVFKANVDVAKELGIEVAVLDAGWFGDPDPNCNNHLGWSENVDWVLKRGDWRTINTLRFPSGIAALSEYVRSKGLKFGIWCEFESVGIKSSVYTEHPSFPARRDGAPMGYICFGNPEAREWAFNTLEHLILDYKVEWLKLDFNVDQKAGCNRTDHGHDEGDGHHAHILGYYEVLGRLRAKYPEVYLENCSSGGLRIDLGTARHTHGAFLSDPDFTRHHLQLFWGASLMLHPSACYHFTWSQNVVYYESHMDHEPIKPDMSRRKFDYIIRGNMLNGFGVSYRLPELPDWAHARLGELIAFFKSDVRRFVAQADMHRLTGQTLRDGKGEGWNAYLFVMEGAEEAMLSAFRLAGGEAERRLRLSGLDEAAVYEVRWTDSGDQIEESGRKLMEEGVLLSGLEEENSEFLFLRKIG